MKRLLKYIVVVLISLITGLNESKAQHMEITLLHIHPLGGANEYGFLFPGFGAGFRVGYGVYKSDYFITGRIGFTYHYQFSQEGDYEEIYTAALSAQWGMHLYKSTAANGPLIYWLLHPQIGVGAYYDGFGLGENYLFEPSFVDRYSYDVTPMTAFGTGPGFETGINSKLRGFIELEIGPQAYFLYYNSFKLAYTSFSAGIRF